MGALVAIVASLLTWKIVGVQWQDGKALVAQGVSQRSRQVSLPAQRGAILDRNGVEMALSLPRRRVVVNMGILRSEGVEDRADIEQFSRRIAALLGVDPTKVAEILSKAKPTDPWVRIAETVEVKTAEKAVTAIEQDGVRGAVTLEESSERVHPAGESALRVLGTLGPDGPGDLAGIEKALDDRLSGSDGLKTVEIGAGGSTILGGERILREPVAGSTVRLTLDRTMQHEVERILADGAGKAGAVRGIAIVGRPTTGEILAVASVERDDKTGTIGLSRGPLAFSNAYQAGSVFKLVTVAAAVESGQVDSDTVFEVPDSIKVADKTFVDHDAHPTEPMTVTKIVADSSNVGTIMISQGVGKKGLYDYLTKFGFGERTGTAHPAESPGILPALAEWTDPDLAASSIGTHQAATAFQLWGAYNVVANAGMYVQPRIVESVKGGDGRSKPLHVDPPRRVVSAETSAKLGSMLQAVVSEGTGKQWTLPGYSVAAKTGTSRMAAPKRPDRSDGYVWEDGHYHYLAAFTGFLPAERPQVSITVLLDDVTAGLYGSTAAGPIFSDLARLSIRELGIAPTSAVDRSLSDSEVLPGTTRDADGRIRTSPAVGQAVPVLSLDQEDGKKVGP